MARSPIIGFPVISIPTVKAIFDLCSLKVSLVIISFIKTGVVLSLGISIPITVFPGIGEILILAAARFIFISSERLCILEILTPDLG